MTTLAGQLPALFRPNIPFATTETPSTVSKRIHDTVYGIGQANLEKLPWFLAERAAQEREIIIQFFSGAPLYYLIDDLNLLLEEGRDKTEWRKAAAAYVEDFADAIKLYTLVSEIPEDAAKITISATTSSRQLEYLKQMLRLSTKGFQPLIDHINSIKPA
jgi:hypothetical protein